MHQPETAFRSSIFGWHAQKSSRVLTEFRFVQPGGMAGAPGQVAAEDRRYIIEERFADFRPVDGLTLPHSYRISANIEGQGSTMLMEYIMSIEQIVHNGPIDAKYFSLP